MYSAAKVRQLAAIAPTAQTVRTVGLTQVQGETLVYGGTALALFGAPIVGAILSPGHRIRGALTGLGAGVASLILASLVLRATYAPPSSLCLVSCLNVI